MDRSQRPHHQDPRAGGHRALPVSHSHRFTGLIFHDSDESKYLLERKYGTVVLDEAHKARRRGGLGAKKEESNNLLDFMLRIGSRAKNLLLGTAKLAEQAQELASK